MADLEIESRQSADGAAVVVRGEVDMATAAKLRDVLNGLVDAGSTRIVLDCRGLDFLDSSGIGVLIAVRKRLGVRQARSRSRLRPRTCARCSNSRA